MPVREWRKQDVSEEKLWNPCNEASVNPMELKRSCRSEPQGEAKRYRVPASSMDKSLNAVPPREERGPWTRLFTFLLEKILAASSRQITLPGTEQMTVSVWKDIYIFLHRNLKSCSFWSWNPTNHQFLISATHYSVYRVSIFRLLTPGT